MIYDLKILNGDMSLDFDPLNDIYTIVLNTEDDYLDFTYVIGENDKIDVYGNNLQPGLNEVVLTVYNEQNQTSYYLYVLKKENNLVMQEINNETTLDIKNNKDNSYIVGSIASFCFIFILLFFTLLFKKTKKIKKF